MKKFLLSFCLFFLITASVLPAAPPIADSTPVTTEKDYYKLMYEQAKAQVDAAHADLLWSVGIEVTVVLGVVAFLLGAQYLNNIRVNQQEIASFEARINASVEASVQTARQDVAVLNAQILTLESQIGALRTNLSKQLDLAQTLITANIKLTNKEYFNSLQFALWVFESLESVQHVPQSIWTLLSNCVYNNSELQVSDYNRLKKITNSVKEVEPQEMLSAIQKMGDELPVYILFSNDQKQYTRNSPV